MSSKSRPNFGVDRATAIAQILQDNIMGGHYSPGDRLPSEADLCTHFEVSRPTLREALGRLTARGLLTARRGAGGGASVTRPDEASACDQISALLSLTTRLPENAHLPPLTEARLQLTYGCAELALLRASDISDLRAEIDVQSDFSIPDEDFIGSVRRMHLALAQASGNPALTIRASPDRGRVRQHPDRRLSDTGSGAVPVVSRAHRQWHCRWSFGRHSHRHHRIVEFRAGSRLGGGRLRGGAGRTPADHARIAPSTGPAPGTADPDAR
ncbi:MAG: GntR family transcriptional regulator [Paracoccaceae bacterium]